MRMSHCAQEIGAHGFLFCFDAQPLLLFDLRVHRADHHGHRQHRKEGKRVAGDREVEFPVGICKHVVDEQHTGDSAEYPPEIALRPARDGRGSNAFFRGFLPCRRLLSLDRWRGERLRMLFVPIIAYSLLILC